MNISEKLFRKDKVEENKTSGNFVVASLNDRLMPIDRGDIYEDPLDEYIQANGIGEVTGGGTMQLRTGEIEYCDVEILLNSYEINQEHIKLIIEKLEELGAPKGSKLTIEKTEQKIEFGKKEGLGIYLNRVNLDGDTYKTSDSNIIVSEIKKLTDDHSKNIRYWQGAKETGLYFYSDSFEKMNKSIKKFVNKYPLCKGARIEKIA
tara:strand:+ start:701 stop:1315 length:615 start_codon:yes stop_codon:yes gene_type:complete